MFSGVTVRRPYRRKTGGDQNSRRHRSNSWQRLIAGRNAGVIMDTLQSAAGSKYFRPPGLPVSATAGGGVFQFYL